MLRSCLTKRSSGTTIAEVPLGLWIVFVGIAFPIFVLAMMSVRFALFCEASREAAAAACQCQTFLTNPPPAPSGPSQLSAVNQALSTAQSVANLFPGVTVGSVQTSIVQTQISNQASTVYAAGTALSSPADTVANMYQIRVTVSGQVQPIITLPGGFLRSVPGATEPIPVTVTEDRVFENPGGLSS
jgi:hypothetical protein